MNQPTIVASDRRSCAHAAKLRRPEPAHRLSARAALARVGEGDEMKLHLASGLWVPRTVY